MDGVAQERLLEVNDATIVFVECRGRDALLVARAVVEKLSRESGTFLVWIAPGARRGDTRAHVEGPRGTAWALLFRDGRELGYQPLPDAVELH